jgi:DNA topoisomerase-1
VSDQSPGIGRVRIGRGFGYIDARGRALRTRTELDRIKRLAIPPAWRDVWICSRPNGHLQATGRDARGRKQYRYHPDWRKVRDENKYEQILTFAAALPALRRRIARDVSARGLSKQTVVAAVVRLLETTLIRVGNDEYSRDNNSFGLTTLRNHHARITRSAIRFRFKGKGGKPHDVAVANADGRLARIVRRCRDLPGQELFAYVDQDGGVQDVGSGDVNDYLREATGHDFTAKNFRTWAGKRNITKAVESVADLLRNTPAICRKCYIHPAIVEAYSEGGLERLKARGTSRSSSTPLDELRRMEPAVLALLRRRQSAILRAAA